MRRYEPRDRRTSIATTARAFSIDPLFGHFTPDLLAAHRLGPGFFGSSVDDFARHGDSWVVEVDGIARGFAGWLGPASFPRGIRREARIGVRSAPAFLRTRNRMAGLRLLAAVEHAHPKVDQWYLGLLVVDPDLQGRGLGSRLVAPGIAAADEQGLPCYLETQKEQNLAWYGRFGFEVTNTIRVGEVPPVWCLTRPAR